MLDVCVAKEQISGVQQTTLSSKLFVDYRAVNKDYSLRLFLLTDAFNGQIYLLVLSMRLGSKIVYVCFFKNSIFRLAEVHFGFVLRVTGNKSKDIS